MSQISQKSISGITSITTPTGIDNQFTLHINDTSEALKLDHAGNIHIHNHVNTTGISSASNFKTGTSDLHSAGLNVAYADVDDFVDVGSNIKLGNAGVITATSFVGDGSDLTNLPAGLGTALSATASSPLNKMYYTNQVLGVDSNITVDVPASASKAYTQYADIKVDGSADLIVAEGDDLIPDILGLADFGTFGGGASAGRIRVNSISNAANDGSPTVQKGLVVTGVTTSTSFSGSGANLTSIPAGQLTGTVADARISTLTSSKLSGALPAISGANLTSLPAQATIANNADNRVITGGSGVNLNGEANFTYNGTIGVINGNTAGLAVGTNAMVSGRPDNVLHLHKASSGTADGPTIYFTNQQTGVTGSDGFTVGINDTQSPYLWNRENTDLRFGTNNAERFRIDSSGRVGVNQSTFATADTMFSVSETSGHCEIGIISKNDSGVVINMGDTDSYNQGRIKYDNSDNSLTFRTVGADRLRIDSGGNVTKPNHCVFQAVVNGSHVSAGSYVVFGSVDVNKGNDYNSSNGIFTAPVAGTYLFHISSIAFNNATTVFRFFLRINNGNTGSGSDAHLRLDMNNDDSDYAPNASYTYYKYMNANDTARVYFAPDDNSASAHGGSDYFKFGGHLVG